MWPKRREALAQGRENSSVGTPRYLGGHPTLKVTPFQRCFTSSEQLEPRPGGRRRQQAQVGAPGLPVVLHGQRGLVVCAGRSRPEPKVTQRPQPWFH